MTILKEEKVSADLIDLSAITSELRSIESQLSYLSSQQEEATRAAQEARAYCEQLKADFEDLMMKQERNAALQRATSELISVRQEIERRFGKYKQVRESMIGILQATDAALVRKQTISSVSEELMITTHDYWLAPVLIAVSAWISNDHDLADRAIREAMRRDEEHTSLLMALICKRNGRTSTCFEWLSRFFNTQNAADMEEDTLVYIDAYINGIFGADEKHICDDYISNWISQISEKDSDFAKTENDVWTSYLREFTQDESGKYPELEACAKEYRYIAAYLGRIDAVDPITDNFRRIDESKVDKEDLNRLIDERLVELVQSAESKERELHEQERYCEAVKACLGDEEKARDIVNARREHETKKRMDLISQYNEAIISPENSRPSERRTALSFLRNYINAGYKSYITEKKETFPKDITLAINGWTGTSADGQNRENLKTQYDSYLNQCYANEKNQIDKEDKTKAFMYSAIGLLIAGAIGLFTVLPLGIICLIAGAVLLIKSSGAKKNHALSISNLNQKYSGLQMNGENTLNKCLDQWNEVQKTVSDFENSGIENVA